MGFLQNEKAKSGTRGAVGTFFLAVALLFMRSFTAAFKLSGKKRTERTSSKYGGRRYDETTKERILAPAVVNWSDLQQSSCQRYG